MVKKVVKEPSIGKEYNFNKHVLIEITKKCNLRCFHCFTGAGKSLKKELDDKSWILIAEDLINNEFTAFTISGGEPLLEVRKTFLLADSIRLFNKKAKVYLFTNGLLLTEKLGNYIKDKFNGVILSLDGNRESHDWLRGKRGSYDAVIKAIGILNDKNIPVSLQVMVTPQTEDYLEEVVKLAKTQQVKVVKFSHVDFFGRGNKNKENIRCSEKQLINLYRQAEFLGKKYNIVITTNLVEREDLLTNRLKFRAPSLHILPDGMVLPWYAFPKQFLLWKYPEQTLKLIKKSSLDNKLKKFYSLLTKSEKKVEKDNKKSLIDYDNVIAGCLKRFIM